VTGANETSSPAPHAVNKESPVSFQANPSLFKARPEKEDIKTSQTTSADEKRISVEKHQGLKHASEPMATITSQAKVTETVEAAVKGPATQVNARAAELAQQIIRALKVRIQNGPTSMRLQLNPKDLGAIDVEMAKDSHGVSVTFFAEQASTGKLLETQMNELRQSLMDSGVQLSELNISQHGQSGQKGGSQSQNTDFAQYSQQSFIETEAKIEETLRGERVSGQLGEVDYLV
jgi:flagellar hook-length control protein FliK